MTVNRLVLTIVIISIILAPTTYAENTQENRKNRSHVSYEIEIENYNPPILEIPDNQTNPKMIWSEQKFTYNEVEEFTDTRTVVDYYEEQPKYSIYSTSTFNSRFAIRSDLESKDPRTLNMLERGKNESFWFNYFQSHPNGRLINPSVEPNDQQEFKYGWQNFQGFLNWQRMTLYPNNSSTRRINIPLDYYYLREVGKYEIPVYKEEEYTRWRKITYENTFYEEKEWKTTNKEIIIDKDIAKGLPENKVMIKTSSTPNIKIDQENKILTPKNQETTLNISPKLTAQKGTHEITIKAYDIENNFLNEKSHQVKLNIDSKPQPNSEIINEKISDEKPDEEGNPKDGDEKEWVGVEGTLYCSESNTRITKSGDDAEVTVDVKRNEGNDYTGTAGWRTNSDYRKANLTYIEQTWEMEIEVSANGYHRTTTNLTDTTSPNPKNKDFDLIPEKGM